VTIPFKSGPQFPHSGSAMATTGCDGLRKASIKVFTAQLAYRGIDRLDISVAGNDPVGKYFAPTWELVMGHKRGAITDSQYTERYLDMMRKSYVSHRDVWDAVLSRKSVTFVCYCRAGKFCHRYILADIFTKLGAMYEGERRK